MHQPSSESETKPVPTLNFFFSLLPHSIVSDIVPQGWLQCVINIGHVEVILDNFTLPFTSPMNLKTKFKISYALNTNENENIIPQCILFLKNQEQLLPDKIENMPPYLKSPPIVSNPDPNTNPPSSPPPLLPNQPSTITPFLSPILAQHIIPDVREKSNWVSQIKTTEGSISTQTKCLFASHVNPKKSSICSTPSNPKHRQPHKEYTHPTQTYNNNNTEASPTQKASLGCCWVFKNLTKPKK